jgi:UDP-3-O-[3-hydroxymyristoyl] glucosamine N-acyltransferase
MPFSLGELAKKIGGELKGDPDLLIYDLATLEEAQEGQLSYVTTPKFRKIAELCKASALLVYPGFEGGSRSLIILKDPDLGFARAMRHFYRLYPYSPSAKSARLRVVHVKPSKCARVYVRLFSARHDWPHPRPAPSPTKADAVGAA